MAKRFPFAKLRRAVRNAAAAAFAEVRQQHPDERFYAFALWTNDLAQAVTAVANSVEGLDRAVARYRSRGHATCEADGLRWSYGDWDYQSVGERYFRPVNELLLTAMVEHGTDGGDATSARRLAKIFTAIVDGFHDLDSEGFFGREAERDGVALMIVGDIDDPFADRCIVKLNPVSVAARLVKPKRPLPGCEEHGSPSHQPTKTLAVSPDGRIVLVATDDLIVCYDVPSFAERKPVRLRIGRNRVFEGYSIESIAFSPDGSEFAVSALHNSYGVLARWRVGEREPHAVTGRLEWGCNALVWSPDGALFAGACRDKVIRIWGVDRFELERELASHECQSRCLGFSADGRILVSLDHDNEACLRSWNPATGAMSWHIPDGGSMFSFVPESDRIAVIPLAASEPREVRFRSCRDGALVDRIEVGIHASAIAFSSDGRLMAIGGAYSTPSLELWDVERRLRIDAIEIEDFLAHGMRFVDCNRAVAVIACHRYGHSPLLVWRLDGVLQSRAVLA